MKQIKDEPIKEPRLFRAGQRVRNVGGEGRTGVVVSVQDDGSVLARLDEPASLYGGKRFVRYYLTYPWDVRFLLDLDMMNEAKS